MANKSSKQTTNQTSTQTVTPNNPDWVQAPAQGLAGNIQNLLGQDPSSFFAGPTDLTQQAFGLFGNLGGQGANWMGQAASLAANPGQVSAPQLGQAAQAQAQSAAQNMGAYFNPYEAQVIGNATADLDRARQLTQNTNGQGAIAAGQYGGSRQGVLDANADEQFLRSVGNLAGQLRHQGFTTAAGLGAGDADRFTNTSQFNAGQQNNMAALQAQLQQQAALANQGASLQGAGLLGGLGQNALGGLFDAAGIQQGLAQQQAGAPLAVNQALTGQYGALPTGQFAGQTVTGNMSGTSTAKQNGGLGGLLGGLGTAAFGLGSLGWPPFGKA